MLRQTELFYLMGDRVPTPDAMECVPVAWHQSAHDFKTIEVSASRRWDIGGEQTQFCFSYQSRCCQSLPQKVLRPQYVTRLRSYFERRTRATLLV